MSTTINAVHKKHRLLRMLVVQWRHHKILRVSWLATHRVLRQKRFAVLNLNHKLAVFDLRCFNGNLFDGFLPLNIYVLEKIGIHIKLIRLLPVWSCLRIGDRGQDKQMRRQGHHDLRCQIRLIVQ